VVVSKGKAMAGGSKGKGKGNGNGNLIKARPERQTSECLMPGNKQPVSQSVSY